MLPEQTHIKYQDTERLEIKEWQKIYHANTYQKEAGIAILILDIVDFKERSHTKNERGHVMVIKWAI